jgi:hypothetical protein
MKLSRLRISVLTLVSLFQISAQGQTTHKIPVTTIVTVLGPKFTDPPAITKHDLVVSSGKDRLDVIDWVPAQGQKGGLQLVYRPGNTFT